MAKTMREPPHPQCFNGMKYGMKTLKDTLFHIDVTEDTIGWLTGRGWSYDGRSSLGAFSAWSGVLDAALFWSPTPKLYLSS
jgi:hypothetical protein